MGNRLARLGMLAIAGTELIGCGGPGNVETPRKGETVEQTDAGTKITVQKVRTRTVRRIKTTCGSKKALKTTKKWDCPELVREYKDPNNKRQSCVECAHESEETY